MFPIAIIWVYDLIWFFPLDFIKFGLQIAFNCSFRAVKPFKQCCGWDCTIKRKRKENAIVPETEISVPEPIPDQLLRQMSIRYTEMQKNTGVFPKDQKSPVREKSVLRRIDEIGEMGANYYNPHMEVLSTLRHRQVMLGRAHSHWFIDTISIPETYVLIFTRVFKNKYLSYSSKSLLNTFFRIVQKIVSTFGPAFLSFLGSTISLFDWWSIKCAW